MKLCRENVYAENYTISGALDQSGFSCAGVGIRFSRVFHQYENFKEIYFTNNMKSSHGVGNIVTNISCADLPSNIIFIDI